MKRGTTGLCGVLAIDKPGGITSHDVVNRVRHITGERRVGHAGTLDPMATGLMLVGVGAATRLSSYLTGHDKTYQARIVFGASTDTDDAQGRIVTYGCAGAPGSGLSVLDGLDPDGTVAGLVGTAEQLPPAYSAIKKNGIVAYKAAREGKSIELTARTVTVHAATFAGRGSMPVELPVACGGSFAGELPYWDVCLHVSKGTYIRAIARDLGRELGCGAFLGALRRTAVAGFPVERACTLEQVEERFSREGTLPWCDPVSLLGFPVLELDDGQAADVANGRALGAASCPHVSCVARDRLLAVYEDRGGLLRPATVIPGGAAGVV